MFKNNVTPFWQKTGAGLGLGSICGGVAWLATLLYEAHALRHSLSSSPQDISAGPFVLHTVAKQQTADGFIIQFSWEPGLVVFLLLWLAIGFAAGVWRYRAAQPALSD